MKMECKSLAVVSDLHVGCSLGLCHPDGIELGEGSGRYMPTALQLKMYQLWSYFWSHEVPILTRRRKFDVIINGEACDGVHHNSVHQWTHNRAKQAEMALRLLRPVFKLCKGRLTIIRGTEAHSGASGQYDEWIARELGCKPDANGVHAPYEVWKMVGEGLVHITHHIGTTSASAYESTAVYRELIEAYVDAARWGDQPPDAIVRSHRHRHIKVGVATGHGEGIAVVTPGWQGKTPFAFKIAGARQSQPQFGGIVLNWYKEVGLYEQHKVWRLERPKVR